MAKKERKDIIPPDQEQRELIHNELNKNMIVEAAAGTGKTTCMVDRMVTILAKGHCSHISKLVAVTFTKKAAAELRSRFRVSLEQSAKNNKGQEKINLESALADIDKCFIGTIHSFCARILRERPVEANIDISFSELDEVDDYQIREDAWNNFIGNIIIDHGEMLEKLDKLGLQLSSLKGAFLRIIDYPDVDLWPNSPGVLSLNDFESLIDKINEYVNHMVNISRNLPIDTGNDRLIPMYRLVPRMINNFDGINNIQQLFDVLRMFDRNVTIVQRVWKQDGHFSGDDAKDELAKWELFKETEVLPSLDLIYKYRYALILEVLEQAENEYEKQKNIRGCLNFQDLLIKTAELLSKNGHIRRYFGNRFTHILVDEFQDTDPIQAEVIMLLTSDDPNESNWRKCSARPGSLFVVGDPKQSIYRFRRADIVTYNQVKKMVKEGKKGGPSGHEVQLSANFRSNDEIINWVNNVFKPCPSDNAQEDVKLRFPDKSTEESPSYVPLQSVRTEQNDEKLVGVYYYSIPEEYNKKEDAIDYDAEYVACTIREMIDSGQTIKDKSSEDNKTYKKIDYSDILIITRTTKNLGTYSQKLQKYNIPHEISGGTSLNEVRELKLLYLCLKAVINSRDQIALVGALRSYIFGISDASLYNYKKAGGLFNYNSKIPEGLSEEESKAFKEAFSKLKDYSIWLSKLPHMSAIEKILLDLGLLVSAANNAGGYIQAGGLAKAIEILRNAHVEMWTISDLVKYLGRLADVEEKYDGISVLPQEKPMVRVMNLHKVKGLEAPIVFLADPTGEFSHDADIHIDRTGDEVQGYMLMSEPSVGYQKPTLAKPENWECWKDKEMLFRQAEELRLRYVAATRAESVMFISQRLKRNDDNPWHYFSEYLNEDKNYPEPIKPNLAKIKAINVQSSDVDKARNEIQNKVAHSQQSTYKILTAKELANSLHDSNSSDFIETNLNSDLISVVEEGEHGVEWGSVIHLLLQMTMDNPGIDIIDLAKSILVENNIDIDYAQDAVDTIESVSKSDLWKLAQKSEQCFTEVPFQVLFDDHALEPIIVRGVIDLIFKHDDGWVLVDYKTDVIDKRGIEFTVKKHAPQINIYADAWNKITGEKVNKSYCFLVRAGVAIELN